MCIRPPSQEMVERVLSPGSLAAEFMFFPVVLYPPGGWLAAQER